MGLGRTGRWCGEYPRKLRVLLCNYMNTAVYKQRIADLLICSMYSTMLMCQYLYVVYVWPMYRRIIRGKGNEPTPEDDHVAWNLSTKLHLDRTIGQILFKSRNIHVSGGNRTENMVFTFSLHTMAVGRWELPTWGGSMTYKRIFQTVFRQGHSLYCCALP